MLVPGAWQNALLSRVSLSNKTMLRTFYRRADFTHHTPEPLAPVRSSGSISPVNCWALYGNNSTTKGYANG